jgi:hypothetical protein
MSLDRQCASFLKGIFSYALLEDGINLANWGSAQAFSQVLVWLGHCKVIIQCSFISLMFYRFSGVLQAAVYQ